MLTILAAAVSRHTGLLLDRPNARSLHRSPTPRAGGIAVCLTVALTVSASGQGISGAVPLTALAVALISLLDDWRAQPVALRLAVHGLAAIAAVASLFPGAWTALLVALVVVSSANLFNFMDGADGLAATMALIGFSTLGWAALGASHQIGPIALIIAGAAGGVLLFNLPPARVFLGDAGSIPLGFSAALLSIWGVRDSLWPAWFPVLVFLPFLLDAGATLLVRVWRREWFWQAHREHLYQRLVLRGWTHTKLLLVVTPIMLMTCVLALLLLRVPVGLQFPAFLGACLSLATTYGVVNIRLARQPD
ncbi:MAG: glycosyltransferase family 4 protein [Betaproteobacteria bacterium]|nr:glycosyltransferase family 4 protein [Betaproteobacteria bacterium]